MQQFQWSVLVSDIPMDFMEREKKKACSHNSTAVLIIKIHLDSALTLQSGERSRRRG